MTDEQKLSLAILGVQVLTYAMNTARVINATTPEEIQALHDQMKAEFSRVLNAWKDD